MKRRESRMPAKGPPFNDASGEFSPDEKVKWEWRVFWPEKCPREKTYKDFSFLDQKPDSIVTEEDRDTYIFSEGSPLDIKLRSGGISYKQLVQEDHGLYGFAKKHHFQFPLPAGHLAFIPGFKGHGLVKNADSLRKLLDKNPHAAEPVLVTKDRRTATLSRSVPHHAHPEKATSEFATIEINGKKFQTLSIESSHPKWLKKLAEHVDTTGGYVMDYQGFLSFTAPDGSMTGAAAAPVLART